MAEKHRQGADASPGAGHGGGGVGCDNGLTVAGFLALDETARCLRLLATCLSGVAMLARGRQWILADAEDVSSEFVAREASLGWPSFRRAAAGASFHAYVVGILKHKLATHARGAARRPRTGTYGDDHGGPLENTPDPRSFDPAKSESEDANDGATKPPKTLADAALSDVPPAQRRALLSVSGHASLRSAHRDHGGDWHDFRRKLGKAARHLRTPAPTEDRSWATRLATALAATARTRGQRTNRQVLTGWAAGQHAAEIGARLSPPLSKSAVRARIQRLRRHARGAGA